MTSKEMRNNPLFMRNQFVTGVRWGFPIIKKQELDTTNIEQISCSDVSKSDVKNLYKGVHFYVDDFRFESLQSSRTGFGALWKISISIDFGLFTICGNGSVDAD